MNEANHGGSGQGVKAPGCDPGKRGFESRLSPEDLNWLAGLLEGEGSFQAKPVISLQMTDQDIVERVAALFNRKCYFRSKRQAHHKNAYQVQIYGDEAVDWMRLLQPLMGLRRKNQIMKAIKVHEAKKAKGHRLNMQDVYSAIDSGESVANIAKRQGFDRCSIYKRLRQDRARSTMSGGTATSTLS